MFDSGGSGESQGCLKPSCVLGPALWPLSGVNGCSEEGRDKIKKKNKKKKNDHRNHQPTVKYFMIRCEILLKYRSNKSYFKLSSK